MRALARREIAGYDILERKDAAERVADLGVPDVSRILRSTLGRAPQLFCYGPPGARRSAERAMRRALGTQGTWKEVADGAPART